MRAWAVIPAAGHGKRMSGDLPKQYRLVSGQPVILHTLRSLQRHPDITGFIVGLARDDACWSAVPTEIEKTVITCEGGATRAETVLRCLEALYHAGEEDAWVVVHDAVRPCLEVSDLRKVLAVGTASDHGAVLALPVNDPLKRAGPGGGDITESIAPDGLWLAQTPQVFRMSVLRAALVKALDDGLVLDPANAMEHAGYHPRLVVGSPGNFKITYESDLALASRLLECHH